MKFGKSFILAGTIIFLFVSTIFNVYAGEIRVGALNPLTGSGGPYGPGMLEAIKKEPSIQDRNGSKRNYTIFTILK